MRDVVITASITLNGHTFSIERLVWAESGVAEEFEIAVEDEFGNFQCAPYESIELCPGRRYTITLQPLLHLEGFYGVSAATFGSGLRSDLNYLDGYSKVLNEGYGWAEIEISNNYPSDKEYIWFDLTARCGKEDGYMKTPVSIAHCYDYHLYASPNPASSSGLNIRLSSSDVSDPIDENEEWELEVYSSQRSSETKSVKIKGNHYHLNTEGWQAGIYILKAKYKGRTINEKVIIN